MAARMLDMHPQTLRKYERLGLVRPARTVGSMRLYSREEIERLRFIKRLVDERESILPGVQQLLSVAEAMQRMRPLMQPAALQRGRPPRLVREMDQLAALLGLDAGGVGTWTSRTTTRRSASRRRRPPRKSRRPSGSSRVSTTPT